MPRRPGQWLVLLRAALVVLAAIVVGVTDFPSSHRPWAWVVVGFFALVTAASGVLSATELGPSASITIVEPVMTAPPITPPRRPKRSAASAMGIRYSAR